MSRPRRHSPGGMVFHVLNRGVGRRVLFTNGRKGPPTVPWCQKVGGPFRSTLSASGHERMVNGRAEASGEKRMDLSEEIAWFGNTLNFGGILNKDGPLVEIGSRSVFGNSTVNRSIFSICNALHQGGLLTLPDVPPSVCYPSGRHRQRRRPKPGGQRNLDPRIGRERASRHGDCQHHGGRGPAVRDRSTQVKC